MEETSKSSGWTRRRFGWFSILLALFLLLLWSERSWWAARRAKAWCEEVAQVLERFREEHGDLPESLEGLGGIPPFPNSVLRSIEPIYQSTDGATIEILLFCPDLDSNNGTLHYFHPEDGAWSSQGYIGPG